VRQVFLSKTGAIQVEEAPAPACGAGEVLIDVAYSVISTGSETSAMSSGDLRARLDKTLELARIGVERLRTRGLQDVLRKARVREGISAPMGYSVAGVVREVGAEVVDLAVGDRVAAGGAAYAHHAELVAVPRNLVTRVPDGVELRAASFATVGAIALQGVRQAQPTLGERVAVLGLGLIGQLTAQLLAANGCRVLGFDPNPARAKLATELGAEAGVSADLEAAAERFTRGDGLDAVIVAASTPTNGPLEQAGEIARLRGRVVVVGLVGMEVPRSLYYRKELDLRMSMSYGPGRYDPDFEERGFDYPIAHVRWSEQRNLEAILELLAGRRLRCAPLVTHRYSIDSALTAYDLITKGTEPFLGVVLDYGADEAEATAPAPHLALRAAQQPRTDRIGIGVVGAGGFAQAVLLPALKAAGGTEAIAIASAGGATARRVGEQYGFRIATADADEVIRHADVDVAFVLTRHDLHAPYVVRALEAGKHVFCEKPLALSRADVDAIAAARAASRGDVMVGFNRRFAPLVQRIAGHFAGRGAPLVMHYRVNAGFIPPEHWVHDPVEGGGRILGEGCHFVDLLHALAGARPVRVFAESIGAGSRFRGDDNVAITIRFADGSVGTVTYTAAGDATLGKEYLEVWGEGAVAILDDFRSLVLAKNRKQEKVKAANQDKGFEEEMRRFVAAVRSGGPMPIPFEELAASTRATIAAVESLQRGVPVDVG